jgi:hypothetical protein
MPKKVKVSFQGEMVDATPIQVNSANEVWNSYLLEDGSTVKMKLVATNVVRLDNKYDPEGNPIYFVKSTNIVSVDAPDSLRKK